MSSRRGVDGGILAASLQEDLGGSDEVDKGDYLFILTEKSFYRLNEKMEIIDQISIEDTK